MTESRRDAPGWPGIPPRWTSSAKTGLGTSLRPSSRVWFTLSHGILNEVYYPRVDQACLRDLGLIVTDGGTFFSEEKRDTASETTWIEPGIPAFRLVNTCRSGRYQLEKEIVTDPRRDVVLQEIRFVPLVGSMHDYQLYVLLAPHLANHGSGNTAFVGDYNGVPMLFAERNGTALAVASAPGWRRGSAGFVGFSDGWQDLTRNHRLAWAHDRAENGNVALVGEIDLASVDDTFVLALAFGGSVMEAGHRARASLLDGFARCRDAYVHEWRTWQHSLEALPESADPCHRARISAAVLRCHEEKRLPGAIIASLSIPWGADKGDADLGGYHLVWPRDLVEAAGGLLAAGARTDALRVLEYLRVTQGANGSWPQNMWVDGEPYWHGIQLDETALPILLVDLLQRDGASAEVIRSFWPMVRRASGYIVAQGPVTQQDRWEEQAGFAPFTLAVEIAALLVAADLADLSGEPAAATYLRETADAWNDSIDESLYITGTALARQIGIDGYYVRIAAAESADAASPRSGFMAIKNRPRPEDEPAYQIISPDALALVRFGLRAPDDPRIVNTIGAIDALLKVETPHGPVWRRYNGDQYGEHEDGSSFNGTGIGRPWPLLTGERAHYEIAAGRLEAASQLLRTVEALAGVSGLIPEQVWDAADIPERELQFSGPSGGATPLVWAHAEHLKLRRSLQDGRVYDMPPQVHRRYVIDRRQSPYAFWRFNHKRRTIGSGRQLRIETLAPLLVHWSADGWQTTHDSTSRDTKLGVHVTDLPTDALPVGARIVFTFFWPAANRWEQRDYSVEVAGAESPAAAAPVIARPARRNARPRGETTSHELRPAGDCRTE
jgi:glucoamylase